MREPSPRPPQVAFARRMRTEPTPSEAVLWQAVRRNQLSALTFRRQHLIPASRFIADFCCPALRIVVEIDGGYHDAPDQAERDTERQRLIEEVGYTFVRVSDAQVLSDLPSVLDAIRQVAVPLCLLRDPLSPPPPLPIGDGERGSSSSTRTIGLQRSHSPHATRTPPFSISDGERGRGRGGLAGGRGDGQRG